MINGCPRLAGFDAGKAGWLSGVNTITYMFSTLICVYTLDLLGRRIVLFYGAVIQGFALVMAGVFVHLVKTRPEMTTQYGGAATFCVFLYSKYSLESQSGHRSYDDIIL